MTILLVLVIILVLFEAYALLLSCRNGHSGLKELRLFLSVLDIPCFLSAHHSTALRVSGKFPDRKVEMLAKLDKAIENYAELEDEMTWHRNHITTM